ncbi:hypothetical protein JXB27_00600, partial [Candidatus Woesearchaeota archaeon]|nr:hypothetical protein [Candidatus Woesearchaeota archaeon]
IAVAVISAVRKYKSEKAMSLKTGIEELTIELPKVDEKVKKTFDEMIQDIKATTRAQNIVFGKGDIEVSKDLKISVKGAQMPENKQ